MGIEEIVNGTPRPSVYNIIGRRGSGKDVTGAALAEEIHRQTGKDIVSTLDVSKAELPKYWKKLKRDRSPSDSILYMSDVHLMDLYARDWREDESNEFIKWLSITRHRNSDVILTTQLTKLIDVQVIATLDALIVKEPSALADRLERPEVRRIVEEARGAFEGKSQMQKWETAFVFTHTGSFVVEDIKKPKFWNEDLSRSFSEKPLMKTGFLEPLRI